MQLHCAICNTPCEKKSRRIQCCGTYQYNVPRKNSIFLIEKNTDHYVVMWNLSIKKCGIAKQFHRTRSYKNQFGKRVVMDKSFPLITELPINLVPFDCSDEMIKMLVTFS